MELIHTFYKSRSVPFSSEVLHLQLQRKLLRHFILKGIDQLSGRMHNACFDRDEVLEINMSHADKSAVKHCADGFV